MIAKRVIKDSILIKITFLFCKQFAAHPFGVQQETVVEDERLSLPLRQLDFDTRAVNLLENKGIVTMGDLAKKTKDEIKDIHGFGEKSLEKVIQYMQELGYDLTVKNRG